MSKLLQALIISCLTLSIFSCQEDASDKTPKPLPPEVANLDVPFFIKKDSLLNPQKLRVAKALLDNPVILPDPTPIEGSWEFALGNPALGLKVEASAKPPQTSPVQLPHLLVKPKTPMWYSTSMDLDFRTYLVVEADDGAQVFQDGRLLIPRIDNIYELSAQTGSTIDIRVLNNQHTGGLKSVGTLSAEQYQQVSYLVTVDLFVQKLIRQAIKSPSLSEDMANQIVTAVESGNYEQIDAVSRSFLPLLITPYIQKPNLTEYNILYERSSNMDLQLDWTNLQTQAPNRFLCELPQTLMCETPTNLFEPGMPYKVDITDRRNTQSFRMSAPPNQLEYSFTAWGNSRGGWDTFSQLVQQMSQTQDAFTIGLGNLVPTSGLKQTWVDFFACLEPVKLTTPLYVAIGPSDYRGFYDDMFARPFYQYFRNDNGNQTFYSWRSTYAAFVVLDPNRNFPAGIDQQQGQWLEQQFASQDWQSAQWRFLIVNQPPYSQSKEGYSGDEQIRAIIDQIAGPTKVDFVLSAYTSSFERLTKSYGDHETTFLVLGGAGAPLETEASSPQPIMDKVIKKHHFTRFFLSNGKIRIVTYDQDGNALDEFEKSK
jgi:hypothetical protein